jgi:PAS domain S-box-containing protein
VRVNETFERWTGHRRAELVGGKRFQDLLTPGGRIYHETHYAPLLRMQGSVREIAVDIVCADGRRLPVLINSVLLTDDAGEPRIVRTTLFDATERKSYERELLAARDREREARERVERLQRITAALAAAPDHGAIAAAVIGELEGPFGAERAAVAAAGQRPPGKDADDAFLTAVAHQVALALERARLYEETRDVAHTLQQSMLAGEPPVDPRFAIAVLYQPAVKHLEVGGDWHDAFSLPDGKVAIVVGDVVGRGLSAASAMGQLRSAVRALAGAGLGPEAVMRHLDTFVEQSPASLYATVAYAEVDPSTGEVAFAAAGHLPPVLFGAEAPRLYLGGRSTPLGVDAPTLPRIQQTFTLAAGDGFVLYTDGLIERRKESLDAGLRRLVESVHPAVRPQELVDALLEPGASEDDVCVLVFRRR